MDDPVMGDDPPQEDLRLSTILRAILRTTQERITVGEIIDAFGHRAFGALLFVFAIPNLLPLPPGSSTVLSLPLLLISPQLVIGTRTLWLPRGLDRRSVRRADLAKAFAAILPRLERVERLMAPRLGFVFGSVGDRLIGLVCLALALVLVLPIPLGNLLPAAAIAGLSLGMTQRDGLIALIGYGIATASVVVLILGAKAVAAALDQLLRLFGA